MNLETIISGKANYGYVVIIVLGLLLFFPFLGGVHLFDWDEINFAEASREMLVSSNYLQVQIDFQSFYEKPPLFLWLQVIAYKLFGVNEFAARFPNALFGIFSMVFIYRIARKYIGNQIAFFWVLMFLSSLLPHFYFRTGIIDPVFNFFIYASIVSFYIGWQKKTLKIVALSGLLIGLAILTKGPVGILIGGGVLASYAILARVVSKKYIGYLCLYTLVGASVAGLWFLVDYFANGTDFLLQFIKYQIRLFSTEDAGHGGFPGYHLVVLLFGCFPASIYALGSFKKMDLENEFKNGFVLLNKILFFLVLILFSIVQSKIVHYSSLCYFPLCFLAAVNIEQQITKKNDFPSLYKIAFYSIAFLFALIFLLFPNIGLFPDFLQNLTEKDAFARSISGKEGPWLGIDNLPFVLILTAIFIFTFFRNNLKKIAFSSVAFLCFVVSAIYIFPSRIEYYTQRDLIHFIEQIGESNDVIYPVNHKSYVHLFYGNKSITAYKKSQGESILEEQNKQDIYLFTRIDRPIELSKYPDITEIQRGSGYIYYKKRASLR